MKDKKATNALLYAGIFAGPFYVLTSLTEALTREGFDLTRHSWSLLSNGDLGWIHQSVFYLTGFLLILFALGLFNKLKGQKAGKWGPVLFIIYGTSLIAAGLFKADPMDGFPIGTPLGMPTAISTSGLLHLVSGMIGFIGLIAACFVFAKRFKSLKQNNWTLFSKLTGFIFLFAFIGIAAGSGIGGAITQAIVLAFIFAVILSFGWISLLALHLLKNNG